MFVNDVERDRVSSGQMTVMTSGMQNYITRHLRIETFKGPRVKLLQML